MTDLRKGHRAMRIRNFVPCPCGSERPSAWQYDARNIPLFRACSACKAKKLAGIRPEVLTNPNYQADEAIEED